MTKIVKSLAVIAFVAAIAVGATSSYFSDTETSTGNTFTAGEINLTLDMDGDVYDGRNMAMFTASDVKPGDKGEETISLHVVTNDAYLCVYGNYTESENGCNEPEGMDDATCGTTENAELDENMNILMWWDSGITAGWQCGATPGCTLDPEEGDNVYQSGEEIYYNGKMSALIMPVGPYSMTAGDTHYMGVEWSVGSGVGNIIQSDGVVFNARFYAEQTRNNANFVCPTL